MTLIAFSILTSWLITGFIFGGFFYYDMRKSSQNIYDYLKIDTYISDNVTTILLIILLGPFGAIGDVFSRILVDNRVIPEGWALIFTKRIVKEKYNDA